MATKWPLIAALSHRSLLPAVVLRCGAMRRLVQEKFNIFGCVGLYARLLQKAEIAEPVDKSKLPRAERYALTIREPAAHVAAVAQQVAGVSAVGINVHLDIWDAQSQHRRKILVRPNRVDLIVGTGGNEECGRNVSRDWRRSATMRKRCGAGIDDAYEVGTRRH